MDFQVEILKAFVDLLKTGGNYAIWGIIAWWGMNLIRIFIISLVAFFSLKSILRAIIHWLSIKELSHKDKVALISKDCSDKLETLVNAFQKDTTEAMKEFLKDAEDLLIKLKDTKKK